MRLYSSEAPNFFENTESLPFQANFAAISDTTPQTHLGQATAMVPYCLFPAVPPALASASNSGDGLNNFHQPSGMVGPWILPDLHALELYHFSHVPTPPDSLNEQWAHVTYPNPGSDHSLPSFPDGIRSQSKKKIKMHECSVCHKFFPRPSSLVMHKYSHTGEKPFPCLFPRCNKSFAVRSNANRHFRTHGTLPVRRIQESPTPYVVGFDPPLVLSVNHPPVNLPKKFKWIPLSSDPTPMPFDIASGTETSHQSFLAAFRSTNNRVSSRNERDSTDRQLRRVAVRG